MQSGHQYFYEVAAVYATNTACSVPFALTPLANSNLIANACFEENDNNHWDKWFTGDIPILNMRGNTNVFRDGRQSMEIKLENSGNNSSIAQYNQYGIPGVSIPVIEGGFYSMGCFFKSGGISQPSEHWLEWSSTKTADNTNNRPNLPWPDYFTPHFKIGTAATGWIYANRVFTLPLGFPNLELRHRFTIAAPGSGSIFLDDVFLRQLPAPADSVWINLVPFRGLWRYSVDSPPGDWTSASFDDSSWPEGFGKFGAGATSNIVTRLPQRRSAYYFRRSFAVTNTELEEFLLGATCTDDYAGINYPLQVYLNGTGIPASAIELGTGQGNITRYFDLLPFIESLHRGTNIIAVAIGNGYASDWDDIAFDASLKVIPSRVSRQGIRALEKQSTSVRIGFDAPPGTIWRLQSCDRLSPANWQTFEIFTNTTSGTVYMSDFGQGGRTAPSVPSARFYRVQPY